MLEYNYAFIKLTGFTVLRHHYLEPSAQGHETSCLLEREFTADFLRKKNPLQLSIVYYKIPR